MIKNKIRPMYVILLITIVAMTGCTPQVIEKEVVKYQCTDGSIVDDLSKCSIAQDTVQEDNGNSYLDQLDTPQETEDYSAKVSLKINSYKKQKDIESTYGSKYTARPGFVYMIVDFTLENIGDYIINTNANYFVVEDSNGYSYKYDSNSFLYSNTVIAKDLYSSGKYSAVLLFEIPQSVSNLKLVYDNNYDAHAEVLLT